MNICKYRALYTNEILTILESKKVCNLITSNTEISDVTPMWYIFDYEDDDFTFYLLCTTDEESINNLKPTDNIGIFFENSVLGFYIDAYQSVTANGNPEFITDPHEKKDIADKFKNKYSFDYKNTSQSGFKYLKVKINSISGRQY